MVTYYGLLLPVTDYCRVVGVGWTDLILVLGSSLTLADGNYRSATNHQQRPGDSEHGNGFGNDVEAGVMFE